MFDTIVFSGGGPAACSFVGAIRYLEHIGAMENVHTMVGTSAGALLAFLCSIGMRADDVSAWLMLHMSDGSLTVFDAEGILEFAERLGVDDGGRIMDCLRETLRERGICENPTFVELAKHTGVDVVVCASNLTEARYEYFGVETTPFMDVITAVRMSIGIPLLFTPVLHRGCYYVDGGLFNNCPLDYASASSHTLALSITFPIARGIGGQREEGEGGGAMMDVAGYLSTLVRAMVVAANRGSTTRHQGKSTIVQMSPPIPEQSPWHAFSLQEMAFVIDPDIVRSHVQYGYDTLQSALAFTPERRCVESSSPPPRQKVTVRRTLPPNLEPTSSTTTPA